MRALHVSASVMKVLLGMMFIFSAVSKFVSVDTFEMYIFSFGFFSLPVSFYVARLAIAVELILGAALISNRYHRFTVLMTVLFLLCFIIFLVYAHLVGRTDSCHCFGELISLDPVQSILKNAILILALLFVSRYAPDNWAPKWWLVVVVYLATAALVAFYTVTSLHLINILSLVMVLVMMCVGILASFSFYNRWFVTLPLVLAPVVTTFILTPPDNWIYNDAEERFNVELFRQQYVSDGRNNQPPLPLQGVDQGRRLVAFLSPDCKYCRLAAGKLSAIVSRNDIDSTKILYVFPLVDDSSRYVRFYQESRSRHFDEAYIDRELFVRITRAAFPVVLLLDEGTVTASFAYRNINEKMIKDFITAK